MLHGAVPAPPGGPEESARIAGRSRLSVPRPYVTHEPMLGLAALAETRVQKHLRRGVIQYVRVHPLQRQMSSATVAR